MFILRLLGKTVVWSLNIEEFCYEIDTFSSPPL